VRINEKKKGKNRIDVEVVDEEVGDKPQGKVILRKKSKGYITAKIEGEIDEEQ
jgi:hypothetical protein